MIILITFLSSSFFFLLCFFCLFFLQILVPTLVSVAMAAPVNPNDSSAAATQMAPIVSGSSVYMYSPFYFLTAKLKLLPKHIIMCIINPAMWLPLLRPKFLTARLLSVSRHMLTFSTRISLLPFSSQRSSSQFHQECSNQHQLSLRINRTRFPKFDQKLKS